MPAWKLTIEYEGTRYRGWQEQKNAKTVAEVIKNAAVAVVGRPVELGGAGRTDAGVHALAQVAHMRCEKGPRPGELIQGLNEELPSDVNILTLEETNSRFDARRDAIGRYYLYQISTRRSAFAKPFVWWVRDLLDVERMQAAASSIAGRHDFISFCEVLPDDRSTIVEVTSAEVALEDDLILFRIGASHFLWKMVRRLAGMLVEVGRRNLTVEDFQGLLNPPLKGRTHAKDLSGRSGAVAQARAAVPATAQAAARSTIAPRTAPPSGLFLEHVMYDRAEAPGPIRAAFPVRRD